VRIAGATVHFVDESVDHGPIILQGAVAIAPEDDVDAVTARIPEVEHQLYPAAIRLFAEDRCASTAARGDRHTHPLPPPSLPLPKSSIGA
jgi:phosphoribosylglycinamide formyltransferase-1